MIGKKMPRVKSKVLERERIDNSENMAIYKLSYAAEHLPELFQEAHEDGDVFILRPDGLTCELVPMTRTFVTDPMLESEAIPAAAMGGELLPT